MTKRRIIFFALETYSLVGGLQNFNRRVVANLVDIAKRRQDPEPLVVLLRDQPSDLPDLPDIEIVAAGESRLSAAATVILPTVRHASIVLIGHVNLLCIAPVIRILKPSTPIILFVHGEEVWNEPAGRARRWFEPLMLRCLDRIASVSSFTARVMASEFRVQPDKYRLLPNAVDRVAGGSSLIERHHQTVLCVSRLSLGDRRKHVDKVIRAISLLKDRYPEVQCRIVGDGPLRNELEELAQLEDVSGMVTFLGRASQEQLEHEYQNASIFILPSMQEGFGIVYLEAWRFGLPVICGAGGAASEVVSNGIDGFVVDPEDVSDLACRLEFLFNHWDNAIAMGARGQLKVEQMYLNKHFQRNLTNLLDELR